MPNKKKSLFAVASTVALLTFSSPLFAAGRDQGRPGASGRERPHIEEMRDATTYSPPAWVQERLTQEELGLVNFLSRITWKSQDDPDPWAYWYVAPSQYGLDGLRYPLALSAYASFILGARTPAYTELAQRQMRNAIERMLETIVWSYIEGYWADEPSFPDPVYVENVMYSGHLLQMLVMYQILTGDDRYATDGFDFVWTDGTIIHYTTPQLAERLHTLMSSHYSGGIACEPSLVFVYCNDHSALALVAYDTLYPGSGYLSAVDRWQKFMQRRAPLHLSGLAFFKLVFSMEYNGFLPYGEAGGDAWGLGWMVPWNPDREFLERGWSELLASYQYIETPEGFVYLKVSPLLETWHITSPLATSFLPFLARQMEGTDSPSSIGALAWLDTFSQWWDADGDGHAETLSYETGWDRNVVSANVAASRALIAPDMLYRLIREPEAMLGHGPALTGVDDLNISVLKAFRTSEGGIEFEIAPARPDVPEAVSVVVEGLQGPVDVSRDGVPWEAVDNQDGSITLTTDLLKVHLFQVVPAT